jgi:hypothetical protein
MRIPPANAQQRRRETQPDNNNSGELTMCGVNPTRVNTRPLQDAVKKAANDAPEATLNAMKDRIGSVDKQAKDVFNALPKSQDPTNAFAPQAGCLPKPDIANANAPAGKGLQKDPEGWPKGSIRTAGGYTIVPEGKKAGWSVFGPEQKPGDKPLTNVHGDPHVQEKDGTKWDFTKSSTFRLPDGTQIHANTTAEHGKSVTKSLDIVNGNDRASITDIDKNKPQTSEITQDGRDFAAKNANRDNFVLGGGGQGKDEVQWARERNGKLQGVITGSKQDVDGKGSYDQVIDKNAKFLNQEKNVDVDRTLRADPFSNPTDWASQLKNDVNTLNPFGGFGQANQSIDAAQNMFNNLLGRQDLGALLNQIRDLARQLFP